LKSLILSTVIGVSAIASSASATTCSVECAIYETRIAAMASRHHDDMTAFWSYCKSMGGSVQESGSTAWCYVHDQRTTSESGYGANSFEATTQANKACHSNLAGCVDSGGGGHCSGDLSGGVTDRRASVKPGSVSCY
jgi:hypothetical protein